MSLAVNLAPFPADEIYKRDEQPAVPVTEPGRLLPNEEGN